ncbi:unnamed protein product [Echinostoma caproni]|uniref:G_PROTEIN_RECEP_F1_2 domain-containing protein n=1 Tax=Echinostoma caproni TaxID=27848 RepID=A0A182ZZ96_9TREM|nr:unnamed protein product [Echinostoma caproni]
MVHIPTVFFYFELFTDIMGILGNALILCFLFFNKVGSRLTTLLMKNQFTFDGLVSVYALVSLVSPDRASNMQSWIAPIHCHVWVSRSLFWFMVVLSETNLVCIAVDRLRAIVFSQSYKQNERITTIVIYVFVFSYALLNAIPATFLVKYRQRKCEHIVEHIHSNEFIHFLLFAAYVWLIFGYLLPATVMAYCHVQIILKTKIIWVPKLSQFHEFIANDRFSAESVQTQSSIKSNGKASGFNRAVTIPAIFMWAVFMLTHAYKVIHFLLYAHGAIDFGSQGVERRLGTFLTIVNSALNPLIVTVSSPPFRKQLFVFLCTCRCFRNKWTGRVSAGSGSNPIGSGIYTLSSATRASTIE